MDYTKFVTKATNEDKRNLFGKCEIPMSFPASMGDFYSHHNPIDVEVNYPEWGAVKFYPIDQLDTLLQDYALPEGCFVFATCNGDPIFLHKDKVFTTIPEIFRPELLAENFDEFLNKYVTLNK